MSGFEKVIDTLNSVLWSTPLVVLCLVAGLWFTFRLKGVQFRLIGDMFKLLKPENNDENGISPFQAFATTVGSRVGMGNLAGVATAIFFGGPGAVFWMWVLALIGAASSFVESTLAQAYKIKNAEGQFVGGPAYFIERALHAKPLAILFAIATVLGPGILMPGLHLNSVASTFNVAFGAKELIVGLVFCALLALVIMGGVKRIGSVAELIAPIMCVVYIIAAIVIICIHWREVPHAFGLIFSSAFGANSVFGGIVGAAIAWGVKRGVYSSEAGQGSGAIVSAAADTSHPAKQGLVQALSVYIDTIVICTASALILLLTGVFNVQGADGSMIVENIPGVTYGILWVQNAIGSVFGNFGVKALAIVITMFVFTSLMGYYYEAESNVSYLFHGNKVAIWTGRVIFILSCFTGVLVNGEVVWSMGDIGVAIMAWINIISIVLLTRKAAAILKDYDDQKKLGKNPVFHPADFEIEDETHVWDKYHEE